MHSKLEDNEDVNDDLCDIQASIASYPEERGEGRRHSKRSARMDEQAINDELMILMS